MKLENTEIRQKMMIDEVDFADMCCVSFTEHTARHAWVEREHKEEQSKHFLSPYRYKYRGRDNVCMYKYIYNSIIVFSVSLQLHRCVYERERERETDRERERKQLHVVCLSHSDLCN